MVNTVDANPKAGEWKSHVKVIASTQYHGPLLTGAIDFRVQFVIPRPKWHFRTGKYSDQVKDSAPRFPTKKPDITKLIRGLEDALTGIIWRDDAQITFTTQRKDFGDQYSTIVIIRDMEGDDGTEGTGMPHAQQGRAESAGDELQADD